MSNNETVSRETRMQETMERWVKEHPHLQSIATHPTMSTKAKYAYMKEALLGVHYGSGPKPFREHFTGLMKK